MFSSPTPAPGSRSGATATGPKRTSLVDKDTRMVDGTENPGGRKGTSRIRSHRPRLIDSYKQDQPGPSRSSTLASRLGGTTEKLQIRGSARASPLGRPRRSAASTPTGRQDSTVVHKEPKTLEYWKEFVNRRWNPDAQFLNLERMDEDEVLKKYDLTSPTNNKAVQREAAVVFKLASQLTPEVKTISFANNGLTSGQMLSSMSRYLPNLVNLSLENNKIKMLRDLEFISARKGKLTKLRELVLAGNPIRDDAIQIGKLEYYKAEVLRRFPGLKMLDKEAVATIDFDAPTQSTSDKPAERPSATTFPNEMGGSFISGVDGNVVSNFFVRFFQLLDTNRGELANIYAPSATFSFSANTSIPERSRVQGFHHSKTMPNQTKLQWSTWLSNGSRNLQRMAGLDHVTSSLHVGSENIVATLNTLPKTRHDVMGSADLFVVDVLAIPQGLLVTVHGQFIEEPSQGVRSFDRAFVLGPAEEGSRAKLNGWEVVIISDQWNIRAYSSHQSWKVGPMKVHMEESGPPKRSGTAPPGGSNPNLPPALMLPENQAKLAELSEQDRALVVRFIEHTGLNIQFSIECLTVNGGDWDSALAAFERVKGTLAKDAYL